MVESPEKDLTSPEKHVDIGVAVRLGDGELDRGSGSALSDSRYRFILEVE